MKMFMKMTEDRYIENKLCKAIRPHMTLNTATPKRTRSNYVYQQSIPTTFFHQELNYISWFSNFEYILSKFESFFQKVSKRLILSNWAKEYISKKILNPQTFSKQNCFEIKYAFSPISD